MNDLVEFIQDLRELQHLYATGDICYIDFQEKIAKYQDIVDTFEQQFESEFEAEHAHG